MPQVWFKDYQTDYKVFVDIPPSTSNAGLVKAVEQSLVHPDERIVVLSTGNGLKDIASARKSVGEPVVVDKDLAAVKRALGGGRQENK